MKILLAVDIQPEFADKDGMYPKILGFVRDAVAGDEYQRVIATKCLNRENSNYVRYSGWTDMLDGAKELEFEPDEVIEKISYGLLDYSFLAKDAEIHVIGYNTGACVLKVALDLFDRDYNFKVLTKYCYSGDGKYNHERGLWTLKNLMEYAVE